MSRVAPPRGSRSTDHVRARAASTITERVGLPGGSTRLLVSGPTCTRSSSGEHHPASSRKLVHAHLADRNTSRKVVNESQWGTDGSG